MRPLPSLPLPPPRRRKRPFHHQMIRTRSEVLIPGMSIIFSNSRSLEKLSSPLDRKKYHIMFRPRQLAHKSSRNNIPATDWASASNAIFTSGPQNTAIAKAVTNLKNLQGIPNALNGFKKLVFTGNLTGSGYPGSGNNAKYYNFYGPAIQKYLEDNQDGLMSGTVDETGNQIQSAANGNADVKSYFTSYASFHYQGCIDYLASAWEGLPPPAAATAAGPTTTSAAAAASVSCEHAADPENTCAAIADGPGWCDCGTDTAKYAMMPSSAPQPCAWTTTPPITSFDCPTPTPVACDVGSGCTNVEAPTGCAVLCP